MRPRLKLKSRWAHGEQYSAGTPGSTRMPASPAPATRPQTPRHPQTAPCRIALRGRSSPIKELAVHGPLNPSGPTAEAGRCPVNSKPAQSSDNRRQPASNGPFESKSNSLGKPCLSLVPRPKTAARLALHIGMSGQPGGGIHASDIAGDAGRYKLRAPGRQSKIDIPARPHACGGRDPFGTGKVRRHDLPRRSPPLSRTWLITF